MFPTHHPHPVPGLAASSPASRGPPGAALQPVDRPAGPAGEAASAPAAALPPTGWQVGVNSWRRLRFGNLFCATEFALMVLTNAFLLAARQWRSARL